MTEKSATPRRKARRSRRPKAGDKAPMQSLVWCADTLTWGPENLAGLTPDEWRRLVG